MPSIALTTVVNGNSDNNKRLSAIVARLNKISSRLTGEEAALEKEAEDSQDTFIHKLIQQGTEASSHITDIESVCILLERALDGRDPEDGEEKAKA